MRLYRTTFVAAASRARRRSYGECRRQVQILIAAALCFLWIFSPAQAQDRPVKLVVLGDSLTAGLGLPVPETFPVKLAQALKTKGLSVEIANAGVSGDTTSA